MRRGRSDCGAAHVFSRGSGISSIRVTGAANVNMQRSLEAHGRRVTRIGAGVRSNACSSQSRNVRSRGWVGPGRFMRIW